MKILQTALMHLKKPGKSSKRMTPRISKTSESTHPDKNSEQVQINSGASTLQTSRKNNVLTIYLNRPAVLNALDMEMAEALREVLLKAAHDSDVRALIISGRGRAFCSGGDLKFALHAHPDQPGNSFLALTTVLHDCIKLIRSMDKPVVAAINGPAAGAGLFLALACDLRIMSRRAYLKQSNTSYGLSLPAGGTYFLPRLLGMGRALEMVMLDQPVDSFTAHKLGMVSQVVPDSMLAIEAELLAFQLKQKAVQTLGRVKRLMNESFDRSLGEQLAAEQESIVQSANHAEGREGLAAFVEKRKAEYDSLG
ncbi:enoyl-CoA hydratase/isomerase family protein [Catalinimonas niigatensis]|uniref:enoyl-CoA hydratase/isomerase family protein n=1 Tax=Catalinimonas niigatensis TaxID=1397264 RepID=UPI002665890E|nr:enoyl-CoA hydratase-related protein [Catalinimonas niigatensis]WPP51378.1 enoyl-CoA hydratase-related protein [Catalinimonas niigatensis]